jgi:hypothetical protein
LGGKVFKANKCRIRQKNSPSDETKPLVTTKNLGNFFFKGKQMPHPSKNMPHEAEQSLTEQTTIWGKRSCGPKMPHLAE